MSKPGDQVSAAGSSPSGPARQHQSHPEETEEELREHQGLSSSSSSSSCTSAQESGPLRGLVIKQEPLDPQEQEEREQREQRERQAEKDFLFRQVRMQSKKIKKERRGADQEDIWLKSSLHFSRNPFCDKAPANFILCVYHIASAAERVSK